MRLDLQSAVILLAALTSSFAAAFAFGNLSDAGPAEARPMLAAVAADRSTPAHGTATQIVRSADGHYWAQADVDGRAVKVLVDTGASVVALTREDAARLGLRLKPDDFTREVQTASGTARAAPVMLDRVAVAGASVDDVEALVVEAGLSHSLLGMSYLGRLSRFEATPSGLTLRP
jgi:aspartyl protease family protein